MGRNKLEGKKPDLEGAIAFIISKYGIVTMKDFKELIIKIERLDASIKRIAIEYKDISCKKQSRPAKQHNARPMYKDILDLIRAYKNGVNFETLYRETGFEEKTIRNILYRMKTTGKITTASRGVYVLVKEEVPTAVDETETEIIETEVIETLEGVA